MCRCCNLSWMMLGSCAASIITLFEWRLCVSGMRSPDHSCQKIDTKVTDCCSIAKSLAT